MELIWMHNSNIWLFYCKLPISCWCREKLLKKINRLNSKELIDGLKRGLQDKKPNPLKTSSKKD